MSQLTPRDDARRSVGEILKRVDNLIKTEQFELAGREIDHAKQIDPKNVYAYAYAERIGTLIEQVKQGEIDDAIRTAEEARRKTEEEHRARETQAQKKDQVERMRLEAEARRREEEEHKRKELELKQKEEERRLKVQKEEARLFRASAQEHAVHHPRVLSEVRTSQQRQSIMVIDDDERLLEVLAEILASEGFIVNAYATTDDAYREIQMNKPDLILSDINLETSTMGGFSFYEKIQEMSELQDIPFLFLSGLTDEALIRAGKEMGVDDYITKPFSEKSLIAAIRGRLRRFGQLRRLRVAS